jgi:hypothetical protein
MIRDKMRSFANQGHGDDMNVSFQVAEVRGVPERPQYNTKTVGNLRCFQLDTHRILTQSNFLS